MSPLEAMRHGSVQRRHSAHRPGPTRAVEHGFRDDRRIRGYGPGQHLIPSHRASDTPVKRAPRFQAGHRVASGGAIGIHPTCRANESPAGVESRTTRGRPAAASAAQRRPAGRQSAWRRFDRPATHAPARDRGVAARVCFPLVPRRPVSNDPAIRHALDGRLGDGLAGLEPRRCFGRRELNVIHDLSSLGIPQPLPQQPAERHHRQQRGERNPPCTAVTGMHDCRCTKQQDGEADQRHSAVPRTPCSRRANRRCRR